ncbi:MAG TPA: alpha/beta hydrolase [Steroidobacteraceae bacterium]|nr:alpha/beta hydrolase [Steroidobacteraceae bacterium]
MTHCRSALCALLAISLVACSKGTSPPSPAADNKATTSQPAIPDGTPRLALTPDSVHIDYRVWGKGEPAVVLIHGWACDSNYWNAQIGALEAKYTVVAVNLAGHGASERNRTDWSIGNYGEDVATVVRQLQNRQVVLVGHSMGADVALEAVRRIGDRVIGIIAVDSLKSIGLPPMRPQEIERQLAPFRQNFIEATRSYVASQMFQKDADPAFVQKVAYDMSLEPPQVGIPSLQSLLSLDFTTILPDIHVPVRAINSDLAPTDEARIRKSLPDFKAEVLDHTDHFLMMDVPQRFNPVLLRDVDELVQRAAHPYPAPPARTGSAAN